MSNTEPVSEDMAVSGLVWDHIAKHAAPVIAQIEDNVSLPIRSTSGDDVWEHAYERIYEH